MKFLQCCSIRLKDLSDVTNLYNWQTGSGKTYTMWGPAGAMVDDGSINSEQGIAPRLFKMLFSEIHRVGSINLCFLQILACFYIRFFTC